jgi:putative PIN family toxin of toxin-antitoxin system
MVAERQVQLCASAEIWDEYDRRVPEVLAQKRPGIDPRPTLQWLLGVARFVEPSPLGKQRSRDPKDDPYIGCALSANAEAIVSSDRDLLALKKPFGIEVLTPIELLLRVRSRSGF